MTRSTPQTNPRQFTMAILIGIAVSLFFGGFLGSRVSAQSASSGAAAAASAQTPAGPATDSTRARRRAARRRQRAAQDQAAQPSASTQVGPTAAQRARDAQILAAQKAQSNATARENDALTQKVIVDQQRQQAEPRIQDAPGPDSTPLAGDPAVMPAASDQPRVQDAPGPAQTLPKTPPASAPAQAPAPAPQP